jgi:hypothetical protein
MLLTIIYFAREAALNLIGMPKQYSMGLDRALRPADLCKDIVGL